MASEQFPAAIAPLSSHEGLKGREQQLPGKSHQELRRHRDKAREPRRDDPRDNNSKAEMFAKIVPPQMHDKVCHQFHDSTPPVHRGGPSSHVLDGVRRFGHDRIRSHSEHDCGTSPSRDSVAGTDAPDMSSASRRDDASNSLARRLSRTMSYGSGGKLEHVNLLIDTPDSVPIVQRFSLRAWLNSLHTSCLWYTSALLTVAVLIASIAAILLDIQWAAKVVDEDRWLSDRGAAQVSTVGSDLANTPRPKTSLSFTPRAIKTPFSLRQRRKKEVSKEHDDKRTVRTETAATGRVSRHPAAAASAKQFALTSVNTTMALSNLNQATGASVSRSTDDENDDRHKPLPPITEPSQSECGEAMYQYCDVPQHQYHYRASTDTCVLTMADHVRVCNHSPDRFATAEECRRTCARRDNGDKPEVCSNGPLFAPCTWLDVKPKWAIFDGKRCVRWPFPEGLCPAKNNTLVFASSQDCAKKCVPPPRKIDGSPGDPCTAGPGPAATCSPEVLRFPYFATNSSDKCYVASALFLKKQRCLAPPAMFSNWNKCRQQCVRGNR